jgi:hypothetical protein
MALVPQEPSFRSFYEAIQYDVADCDPWVVQNVLPVMDIEPVLMEVFQFRLSEYLRMFNRINLIADWPEDISWFCRSLITGPGMRMNTPPIIMQIIRVDTISTKPHNALADAMGIRDYFASK